MERKSRWCGVRRPWARSVLFATALLLSHGGGTHGKTINAYIQTSLREFSDIYLGQFTFDKRGGRIKVKTAANVKGQRFLFFDGRAESWPTILATYQSLSCRDLRNVSLVVASSPDDGEEDFGKVADPEWLSVTQDKRDNSMSEGLTVPYGKYQADLQLSPTPDPAQWYTMLSNCDDVIDIDFALTLLNPGGWWYQHFSVDEQGLLGMFVGWTVVYSCIVVLFVFMQIQSYGGYVHPFMALLSGALLMEYMGIMCQTWHGWTYASDGEGLVVVQALGEVLDSCSNLLMMLMLLMMARGWTVSSAAITNPRSHFSKDWVISMTLFLFGFLSLFVVERMGRAIDARYCYDSDIGLLALVLRNAVYIYFCLSLARTIRIEVSEKRRKFLVGFGVASSVWFLGLPCAYYYSQFLPAWDQMKVVIAASTSIHTAGLFLLAILVWPDLISREYITLQASDQHATPTTSSTPYDEI